MIDVDMNRLETSLGDNFPGYWNVLTGVTPVQESRGYFRWLDQEGTVRDKFMVCSPVKDSRFVVAATAYVDEFTRPVVRVAEQAGFITVQTRATMLGVLGSALLLMSLSIAVYGYRLTGRVRGLAEFAERISVGELDTEIEIHSKDEIGALAQAIVRMQESIRLSLERLRKRR
jgi:HAMP domain-containing protein